MQHDTIEKFAKVLEIDFVSMEQNSSIDVKEKNIGVLTYIETSNKNEFRRVNKFIRKQNAILYTTKIEDINIKTSNAHKFFARLSPEKQAKFFEVKELYNLQKIYNIELFNQDKGFVKIDRIEKGKEKIAIYDLEIDTVHSFYTNGFLSHNSMGEINIGTGGLAWRFYTDMRFKFAKVQTEKDRESNKTEVNIIKNKCGSPWGKAIFHINWGIGIDKVQEIIDFAVEFKLIAKGGSWYTISEDLKLQGDEKLKQFMEDNPEFLTDLEQKIIQKIKEAN